MTKRTDEKELYLAALRGDVTAQRACTEKGKACGGRCIPKHWNCRIKGEGETPPTRGNAVQLSAEQKEKIKKVRSRRRTRRALTAIGGATAVGAAVAGAAALGAKNPALALKLKRKSGTVSQGLGVASAFGGPTASAAGVANMAVGGFNIGAGVGMSFARRKRDLGAFKRLTRQRFRLEKEIKPLESARNRAQSTLSKAQEKLSTEKNRLEAAKAAMQNKGKRRSGFALGQNPQSIAQTDRVRTTNLKSAETAFRRANNAVNKAQSAFNTRESAYQSAFKKLNTTTSRASKLRSKLLKSQNPIQNAYNTGISSAQRSFRAGRRTVSGFIRSQGIRGPKPDPRSWQERFGLDEAEREDKKCGNSGIPDNAKCTKKNTARTIAKAAAGAALVVGGAAALKNRTKIRSRFRKTGLTPYQKEQLKKMRAKGTGKYGGSGFRKTGKSFRPDAEERTDVVFENKELHARVKAEAKKKFKVYPSAYANAWMVKEYKKRGGGFRNDDLKKWFNEKWVRMSAKGEILGECGDRDKGEGKPRCLPLAKARALSKKERAKTVRAKRKADPKKNRSGAAKMVPNTFDVEYRGEEFSGYNKPKRTPNHPKKSHAVLAKEGGQIKLIRFGQQGVKGSPPKKNESESYTARRRSFKARHAKNIAKGKMSAAYWANRSKW